MRRYRVTKVDTGELCLLESDDETGAISVLEGPPELKELAAKAFSQGLWRNRSFLDDDGAWNTTIERIDPNEFSDLFMLEGMLARFGFELELSSFE